MIEEPTPRRVGHGCRRAALVVALLLVGCARSPQPGPPAPGEWRMFEGTWSAAGTRHTLKLEPDRSVSTFHLTGSLLLQGERRLGVGFRAEVIGLSDPRTGMQGRAVWTDEHGHEVYSELKGDAVGPGGLITGNIIGGTGRYAGVTGDYTFHWQYVIDAGNDELSGRAVDLKGRVRAP